MYNYRAVVRRVVDGDTVDVDIDLGFDVWLKDQRIRLYRIDTPEKRTRDPLEKRAGLLASRAVSEMLPVDSSIEIYTHKDATGKYGRILGELYTEDGVCVNDWLVDHRYAVEYTGQSKEDIRALHEANWTWLAAAGLL